MTKGRYPLAKFLLIGTLLAAGAVPASIDWEKVYASDGSSAARSVSDIRLKLLSAMNKRQDTASFLFRGKTSELKSQLKLAFDQAMESDPYVNYTIESYGYSYKGSSNAANVNIRLKYRETAAQTAYVSQRVQEALANIITPGMNDHQKIKAIHDWVVLNLQYDMSLEKYTAYDGLSTGSTVCQGYSLLTYKMLKEAGITNKIVEGTATPANTGISQLHAWNLVLLDGKWYHLDTTWDDPAPDRPGEIGIGYYLRTDEQMRKDHSWTKSYPAANTLYRDTLKNLIVQGGVKASFYRSLEKQLEYNLYESKEIVRSSDELAVKVRAVVKQGGHALLFRYQGDQQRLIGVLQDLYRTEIRSISYVHAPFEDTGDLKVYITWK